MFRCPLRQFSDGKAELSGYLRVTPDKGVRALFTDSYHTPATPPEILKTMDVRKLRVDLAGSGMFAVGEGEYVVEALIVDQHGRFFRKRWKIRAARNHSQSAVALAVPAGTVAYVGQLGWDGKLARPGTGRRVTILLDAAALRPGQSSLRAWDRALLLQVLAAVLEQVPCESVRLVAFNLDQQREIFRTERLDSEGFETLSRALRSLELGTVSYRSIQRGHATELLARLTNTEINAEHASDTVIFLGPSSYITEKTPPALLAPTERRGPRFYYLEYFPFAGGFPDAIHNLIKTLHGTVFEIHSPGDLAKAIPRMTADMQARESAPLPSRASANQ